MPRAHQDIQRSPKEPRHQGVKNPSWKRGSFSASSDKWRRRRKTDARWSVKHRDVFRDAWQSGIDGELTRKMEWGFRR